MGSTFGIGVDKNGVEYTYFSCIIDEEEIARTEAELKYWLDMAEREREQTKLFDPNKRIRPRNWTIGGRQVKQMGLRVNRIPDWARRF